MNVPHVAMAARTALLALLLTGCGAEINLPDILEPAPECYAYTPKGLVADWGEPCKRTYNPFKHRGSYWYTRAPGDDVLAPDHSCNPDLPIVEFEFYRDCAVAIDSHPGRTLKDLDP